LPIRPTPSRAPVEVAFLVRPAAFSPFFPRRRDSRRMSIPLGQVPAGAKVASPRSCMTLASGGCAKGLSAADGPPVRGFCIAAPGRRRSSPLRVYCRGLAPGGEHPHPAGGFQLPVREPPELALRGGSRRPMSSAWCCLPDHQIRSSPRSTCWGTNPGSPTPVRCSACILSLTRPRG